MEQILLCQLWSIGKSAKPHERELLCSLHIDGKMARTFTEIYWENMPIAVPEGYYVYPIHTENGSFFSYQCRVDGATYKRVCRSRFGLWSSFIPPNTLDVVAMIPPCELTTLAYDLT